MILQGYIHSLWPTAPAVHSLICSSLQILVSIMFILPQPRKYNKQFIFSFSN
jgi:hypothetical protein